MDRHRAEGKAGADRPFPGPVSSHRLEVAVDLGLERGNGRGAFIQDAIRDLAVVGLQGPDGGRA